MSTRYYRILSHDAMVSGSDKTPCIHGGSYMSAPFAADIENLT